MKSNQSKKELIPLVKKQFVEVIVSLILTIMVVGIFALLSFIPSPSFSVTVKGIDLPLSVFIWVYLFSKIHCTFPLSKTV